VPSNYKLPLYPVLSLLLGATMWGVIWYPMRLLEERGLHGVWLTLILYAAALVVTLPWTWRTFADFVPPRPALLLLALTAGWTNTAFVLAVLEGNILRVMLLFYLSPLWTVILGWLFLGERLSRLALTTLVIAMVGAVTILWNPGMGLPWPATEADWLAISAGLAFAASNVIVRKATDISLADKAFAVWLGVVLVAGCLLVVLELPAPRVGASVVLAAALLGVLAILAMTLLVQYGVAHMPVHRSAVIMLFELVAGAVSQQLLTTESMSGIEWAGGALIIIAAYVSARF
jgi:drug/metabolite transporter (DMT)-like permease